MLDVQLQVEGLSELTKAVLELPGLFARARASALKSIGWELQQELRRAGQLGVQQLGWSPLNPHTGILSRGSKGAMQGRWMKMTRGRGRKKERIEHRESGGNPMGRLVNAVRYEVDTDENLVMIGFLRNEGNLFRLARLQAEGFETRITPRMRKFFFALGAPLKKETTVLKTPARPWVSQVYARERARIPGRFEEKFWAAMQRYWTGSAKR